MCVVIFLGGNGTARGLTHSAYLCSAQARRRGVQGVRLSARPTSRLLNSCALASNQLQLPAVPLSALCGNWFPLHGNDVVGLRRSLAVFSPVVHQLPAFLDRCASAICLFRGV